MAGFGETVESLLETYSKCLSLLKGLKGTNSSKRPRQLRKSIRSDRSKVRSVYSSRLSMSGSDFEKGDAAARSSLRKVIKRLTSAMTRLLHLITRGQKPVIDYHSLRTLSNSSRIDAVKTIKDLSRRLNATSSNSISSGLGEKSKRQKRNNPLRRASKHKVREPPGAKLLRGQDGDEESEKETLIVMDAPSHTQQVYVKERSTGGNWRAQKSPMSLPYARRIP
ncbi:uncharacterized protein LY79DRAFT_513272 [Colletotrichum navitas]|uniref:Uncharacterized protein n=1 Tax=Colletotrichum navitas TaxID=681940 RepID=A0AAD8Q1F3_9PEZI|nr:uncharacterized protein LY79DRAFT_513272 [Colletotrichum navitas]KAK1594061.1 hypothetical protein LY79DRAFT_513272 [Colletotrichum navitas]